MEEEYATLTVFHPLTLSTAARTADQSPVSKGKNRRYRNAKITEYKLRQVVESFARDLTAKDTAEKTRLSLPTVEGIFMRLRERLYEHGFMRVQHKSGEEGGAVAQALGKKYRGIPRRFWPYYEAEMLHRAMSVMLIEQPLRLRASEPKEIDKAIRLYLNEMRNKSAPRYRLTELLRPHGTDEAKPEYQRPFEPSDYRQSSVILVNELMNAPADRFFRYLWQLLLEHPL